tara:strand:- start:1286 stop:2119 length:834 start_codon:yes stop_codon:yes gene_type:complete
MLFKNSLLLNNYINRLPKGPVGLVPTMGSIHEGHIKIIKKSLNENLYTIVSIFVNPTQFDEFEDYINYPRDIGADIKILNSINKNILVYTPKSSDLYGDNVQHDLFNFDGLDLIMEGSVRKNHFHGVATVVKKLILKFNPLNIYFGEKDFQQMLIIKNLLINENLNTNLISCKTVRDNSGLALSSRNSRLSEWEKIEASLIYKTLQEVKSKFKYYNQKKINEYVYNKLKNTNCKIEYFFILNEKTLKPDKKIIDYNIYRAFIAVRLGKIRLIDNIKL